MAKDLSPRSEFKQKRFENLIAESDVSPSPPEYVVPSTGTFDPNDIEIIVDLSLNEMLLYFYGRHIPHDVKPKRNWSPTWLSRTQTESLARLSTSS